jgi:hypothetical protein
MPDVIRHPANYEAQFFKESLNSEKELPPATIRPF